MQVRLTIIIIQVNSDLDALLTDDWLNARVCNMLTLPKITSRKCQSEYHWYTAVSASVTVLVTADIVSILCRSIILDRAIEKHGVQKVHSLCKSIEP